MEASTVVAGPGRWNPRETGPKEDDDAMEQAPPPGAVRWLGYTAAAWCLGFAGVSVWLAW
jgi:hypothetical protein